MHRGFESSTKNDSTCEQTPSDDVSFERLWFSLVEKEV